MTRRVALLGFALVLSTAGCTWIVGSGRDLASGIVEGLARGALKDSTRIALDSVATRTGRSVARALGNEIAPVVDTTLAGLLARSRGSLLITSDSLEARLRGPLRQAIGATVRSSIAGGTAQLRADADPTVEAWASAADRALRPVLARAAAEAVDSASVRLARHLNTDLGVAAETVTARVVRTIDRNNQDSDTWKELRRTLAIVGGIVLLALGLFAAWLWRERGKSHKALEAVAHVINRQQYEYLKPTIKEEARKQDIEGWLNSFLGKHDLL